MRINQYLAHSLGYSRRQTDQFISSGLVEINGKLAEFSNQVGDSDTVKVFLNNQWQHVLAKSTSNTILFCKPIFCLSTRFDPQKRKTIYNHIPKIYHELKSAGRLDYMSEGLLVLSTDGYLINRLTSASFDCEKVYLIGLRHKMSHQTITQMEQGMFLDGVKLNPIRVQTYDEWPETYDYLKLKPDMYWYVFVLTEGKNNQIRRMCDSFGHRVQRLIRLKHGEFTLTEELYNKKIIDLGTLSTTQDSPTSIDTSPIKLIPV